MPQPVLIVGASLGGLRCAEALRREGYEGPIKVLGEEIHMPYNRPPLSKNLLTGEGGVEEVSIPPKDSVDNVEWVLGTRAVGLDPQNHIVTDSTGTSHPYSAVVIATGLRPKPLPIDSHGLSGIYVLRTIDDALALRGALAPGARVLILGAGFIGCEVAATAVKAGCAVKVVSRSHEPISHALGTELSAIVKEQHIDAGVEFITGASIFGLIGQESVERVILDSGVIYDTDVLVVAIGSLPNTQWLEGTGIDITDGVLVNNRMQALDEQGREIPGVLAIGDVARYSNPLFDDVARRVEHWNLPSETAKRAAETITAVLGSQPLDDEADDSFAPLPSFWSDQYDMHILAFGMTYLATESRLVESDDSGQYLFEYFRGDELVGVCGIGLRSKVQAYRSKLAAQRRAS